MRLRFPCTKSELIINLKTAKPLASQFLRRSCFRWTR